MNRRLMCITAHPDDECGAFGGALMMAHARGVETSVICLTEGRAASNRGSAANGDELGELRRKELAAALRVLEVDYGEVLNYPDGGLSELDFLDVVTTLVTRIRRLRPQIVLTFGGDGNVNRHSDHTMVSFFATAAFHWAGRENLPQSVLEDSTREALAPYHPQKLYYAATSFLASPDAKDAQETALVPPSLTLELGGELTARKFRAFKEHRSQAAVIERLKDTFEKIANVERYLLVASRGIHRSPILETDMFQGLEQDD